MAKTSDVPKFGVLSGIKVISTGTSIAGPHACAQMADWGADVIWIENKKAMDPARLAPIGEQDRRNQRSLVLDIPTEQGKKVLLRLVRGADILVESSKGGQWAKWGLTDEVLWEQNPALVIVHVSGYGQSGDPDYVKRPAHDPIAQAFGCHMLFNGFPDRDPITAAPYTGDYYAALLSLGAGLAALYKAKTTGIGESIDTSQFEALVRMQGRYALDYFTNGVPVTEQTRAGKHSDKFAGWGLYGCKDGKFVYIVFVGAGPFSKGLKLLGLEYGSENYPEGSVGCILTSPGAAEIEKRLKEYCLSKTAEEAEAEIVAAGIPCDRVMSYEDAGKHPHYQAREVFVNWESVDGKKLTGVGVFPKFKKNPGQIWRGMPEHGQDSKDILTELGFSEEEIDKLSESKVI